MAKKKADYVAQGYADAKAGMPRAAICAATWQAAAYDSGYNDGVAEAQKQIAAPAGKKQAESLVAAFRKGVAEASRRVFRDQMRKRDAILRRIAHNQKMRSLQPRRKPKTWFIPAHQVSNNITRGQAWDRYTGID